MTKNTGSEEKKEVAHWFAPPDDENLGLVTSYTLGSFIHTLLVLAIIVILIRVIQGRRPIP